MSTNTAQTPKTPVGKGNSVIHSGAPATSKEAEPTQSVNQTEEEILSEIVKTSDAADDQAEAKVREAISEIKKEPTEKDSKEVLAVPKPKIPPDVADAGVVHPQEAANDVIVNGPSINVDITEEEYKKALDAKFSTKSDRTTKVVVGVPSIIALAMWVARMAKKAHGHALRIVFRRGAGTVEGKDMTVKEDKDAN